MTIPGSAVMSNNAGNAGRYRLIFELGRGGMADVILAVIQGPGGFNKLQVLKFLREEMARDPEFCTMFLDEARLSARINHPNVAQTNEVGFDGKRYFFAMEYLEGHSLDELLHRLPANKRPLPIMLRILADACAGLHFAHELKDFDGTPLNVIHRDVSPQNIFVTYDGAVKLLDFGIAKASDSKSQTEAGTIKGKIGYMAPEQLISPNQIDRRADIFSVGAILWRVINGKRLWSGATEMEVLQRLAAREIPAPVPLPGTPEELVRICKKAMAVDVEQRYATAAALHSDLEDLLTTLGGCKYTDVSGLVSRIFADRRREVRAAIDARLSAPPPSTTGTTHIVPLPRLEPASAIIETESNRSVSSSLLTPPPPRGFRANWGVVGAGVMVALGLVAAAFVARAPSAPAVATSIAPVASAASGVGPGAGAAAGGSPVQTPAEAKQELETEITFDLSPTNAQVFLDDKLITSASGKPPHGIFPRDGRDHTARVESDGFVTKTMAVSFRAASVHVEVSLEKERRAPAPQWRPPAPRAHASPPPPPVTATQPAPPPAASPPAPAASPPAAPAPPPAQGGNRGKALDKEDPWKK
ncbi:serine/threonine protein kinase [Pendulispora albinea]|uniref:Serine/threonine protein kinase n=1 Tax=Pendulispora albinea TaxID=2741071 RepID=A0ABZ2LQD5_9BACT